MTDPRLPTGATTLTRPFWDAAARRQLVRPWCPTCGRSHFTPQLACPHCLSEGWTWEPSVGRGAIYSHTVVHRAPQAGFEVPYVVADVDVDEGWHLMTNVVGCPPTSVHAGQRVRVAWVETTGGTVLPMFEPDVEVGT